jgi:hypothetical protein
MEASGFDCLGCENPDYVGFDYMSLLKGTGGLLSGFGGSGGKDDKSTADQIKQQMQLQQAQQSASTMKMVLIGLAVVVGMGGFALALRR